MKLYLEQSEGVRLRLSQDEFRRLAQGAGLESSFALWGSSELRVSLRLDATLTAGSPVLASHPEPFSLGLLISPELLEVLKTPSKKGVAAQIDAGGAKPWKLGLEVDLKKS